MADLKITPARLELLRAIADPDVKVYQFREFSTDKVLSTWDRRGEGEKLVTAKAGELLAAGLISLGRPGGPSWYARKPWELTDAGAQVLAAHEGAS